MCVFQRKTGVSSWELIQDGRTNGRTRSIGRSVDNFQQYFYCWWANKTVVCSYGWFVGVCIAAELVVGDYESDFTRLKNELLSALQTQTNLR